MSDIRHIDKTDNKPGFWWSMFRAEALVQIVWAIVIGAVAITAIVVYGGK